MKLLLLITIAASAGNAADAHKEPVPETVKPYVAELGCDHQSGHAGSRGSNAGGRSSQNTHELNNEPCGQPDKPKPQVSQLKITNGILWGDLS